MHYDPIKRSLGNLFNRNPFLRKVFYDMLDLLLLRAWHIHRELKKWKLSAHPPISILDAGAGFGQYTLYLHRMNSDWNILSVDVKEEQVQDCNQFFQAIGAKNVLFQVADLTQFKKDKGFDLALSVDVMEHIEDDMAAFRNIHASLKEGGMLLISTPSDQGGSDVSEESGSSFIEEHVRNGYNIMEIQDKLRRSGFAKIEARYAYGVPGKISWRLSMKYPILMLGVSKLFFILLPFYYLLFFPLCLLLNYIDARTNHATGTGLIVKAWK